MKSLLRIGASAALFVGFAAANPASAKDVLPNPAPLLGVFPEGTGAVVDPNEAALRYTEEYRPSGSSWAEGLDEEDVFHALIERVSPVGDGWELRVGRGAQVYSLRGPFGEAMAPQWRRSFKARAPWMDEVIQLVAVNSRLNRRDKSKMPDSMRQSYFIHQAGSYPREEAYVPTGAFYSPMLASEWRADERAWSGVVWGQQAHVPSVFRSGALYYVRYRDVGAGAIELSYLIANFGDDDFNYLNTPWGGVRRTTFPNALLSRPGGGWDAAPGMFAHARETTRDIVDTGGWIAFAGDGPPETARALAVVFGRDRRLAAQRAASAGGKRVWQSNTTRVRWGRAGAPRIENDKRDLNVFVVNPRCVVRPGDVFLYRCYLVTGALDAVARRADRLVDAVDYGPVEYPMEESPLMGYRRGQGKDADAYPVAASRAEFLTFAHPVPGFRPLFLLEETATGRRCITTDPYAFCEKAPYGKQADGEPKANADTEGLTVYRPYDGRTRYLGLLGYGVREAGAPPAGYEFVRLGAVLGSAWLVTDECKADRETMVLKKSSEGGTKQ